MFAQRLGERERKVGVRSRKTANQKLDVRGNGRPAELRDMVEHILREVGENPRRSGLIRTPDRVERMLRFITQGYKQNIDDLLNDALFPIQYDEMVIVKDIDFFSLCEHHLLPFFGRCHVGYMPNKRVVGLSKIPRLVDAFSRRLQVQERLTVQIAETLQSKLNAHGVAVVMEARHLCMMMRGVEKQNTVAVTSSMLGVFRNQLQTREEFLKLIHRGGAGDPD
jgi:GTP cyclohydrolase I